MANNKKHLVTDNDTDPLLDYYMNEDKFNEEMRKEFKDEYNKKDNPKTDKKSVKKSVTATDAEIELPKNSSSDVDADFDSDSNGSTESISENSDESSETTTQRIVNDDVSSESSGISTVSPYKKKINSEKQKSISKPQLLARNLVGDAKKYVETVEEKRRRGIEYYSKLQDLKNRYGISLTREFTIDSDPDEMQAEYEMHKQRRNKENQVKFYKQMLINVTCGIEMLNEKFDPFSFHLKDWSKQVAMEVDDYTEVLEEIYEKYKDTGGQMAPELRLVFALMMSAVGHHVSSTMFGSTSLSGMFKTNQINNAKLNTPINKNVTVNKPVNVSSNTPANNLVQKPDAPEQPNNRLLQMMKKNKPDPVTNDPVIISNKSEIKKSPIKEQIISRNPDVLETKIIKPTGENLINDNIFDDGDDITTPAPFKKPANMNVNDITASIMKSENKKVLSLFDTESLDSIGSSDIMSRVTGFGSEKKKSTPKKRTSEKGSTARRRAEKVMVL